ncbi:MAG: ABC transporter ATP-binding protein [Anaerolineae bacterium]
MMSLKLEARHLSVRYGDTHALAPVTFTIQPGQFVTLVGPSGSGKSTLVRVFAGLIAPTEGMVLLGGERLTRPSPLVGLMFQQANLMPWRTVEDNIALTLELQGVSKEARLGAVRALLPLLGLEGFEKAYPAALSGGMAQRAALGRVLVQQPQLLLLDEPFGALDALTREKISVDLLRIWAEQRQTVFMVTHDINEAVFLSDRVLVMSARPGHLIADIPVELPRPRHVEQIYDADFAAVARQVRAAIATA